MVQEEAGLSRSREDLARRTLPYMPRDWSRWLTPGSLATTARLLPETESHPVRSLLLRARRGPSRAVSARDAAVWGTDQGEPRGQGELLE